jgi:hypothetical protein
MMFKPCKVCLSRRCKGHTTNASRAKADDTAVRAFQSKSDMKPFGHSGRVKLFRD